MKKQKKRPDKQEPEQPAEPPKAVLTTPTVSSVAPLVTKKAVTEDNDDDDDDDDDDDEMGPEQLAQRTMKKPAGASAMPKSSQEKPATKAVKPGGKECLSRRTSVVLQPFYLKASSFISGCRTNALQTKASPPNSQAASSVTRSPLRPGCFLKISLSNLTTLSIMDAIFRVVVCFGRWLAGLGHCEGGCSFHRGLCRCIHA